jgi:HemY protein
MRPTADGGCVAVARAAIDARDFSRAREALAQIIGERPTQGALILMAELEEAETGDSGRARGWLARAVYAPRDPVWTADGVVLEEWAPVSPVTGKLDAVEWKVPVAEIEGPRLDVGKFSASEAPAPTKGAAPAKMITTASSSAVPTGAPEGAAAARERAKTDAPAEGGVATSSAPVTLLTKTEKATRRPTPVEPPRPDDPGVIPSDEDEEEPGALPSFLRSGQGI